MAWGERFWPKVEVTTGCWLWNGYRNALGYGVVNIGTPGRKYRAHRVVYEALRGPIPEDLELDHLCRNPSCVNPDHLEPVTHLENVRRGRAGEANRAREIAKTHCKRGHPFNEKNTHWTSKQRVCRACRRERHARYKTERRAELSRSM